MSKAEVIVFNGIKFRRYPDSKHANHRKYYSCSGNYASKGIRTLHQEIWKSVNGPIPEKHCIHHKDENPSNNRIENLECVHESDHMRQHTSDRFKKDPKKILAALDVARKAAAIWHGSRDGLEFHKKIGKYSWKVRGTDSRKCVICGKSHQVPVGMASKFCSNGCKSENRRRSGVDDIFRECSECLSKFKTNRYSKKQTCSKKCAVLVFKKTLEGKKNRI